MANEARWAAAEFADPKTPFVAYTAPALPDWSATAPAHVTWEFLGRFLQDRGIRVVHDVYAAKPECQVGSIRNGTFFHFWSEVVADTSVRTTCHAPTAWSPEAGLDRSTRGLKIGRETKRGHLSVASHSAAEAV